MTFDSKFKDKLLSGSITYFEKFINDNQIKAHHISYNILRNKEMAEEAVQEGIMKFYTALRNNRLDKDKNIEAYFFSCIRNSAIDIYRKNKLYEEINFSSLENKNEEYSFDIGKGNDYLTNYEKIMNSQNIWNMLQKLPTKFREVLLMIEYENMNAYEVAQITKSNVNTVRWRLFRAKEILKNILTKTQISTFTKIK